MVGERAEGIGMPQEFLSGLYCPLCALRNVEQRLMVKVEGYKGCSYCENCGWKSPRRPVENRHCEDCGKTTSHGYSQKLINMSSGKELPAHYLCLRCGAILEAE